MTEELEKLLKLFQTSTRPLTARRIAERTNTYLATAKRRVEMLQESGVKLKKVQYREGKRGPMSTAWVLG